MTRTFIAIDLSDEAREQLHQEIRRLAQALPHLRWVDPATLHLTLSFLGELDDAQLEQAIQVTIEAAKASKPFTLRLGTLGTFGPAPAPRVVWIGVTGNMPRLFELQSRLAASLVAKGFPSEERPYSPHLTLARMKDPLTAQELATLRRLIAPASSGNARHGSSASAQQEKGAIPVAHLSVMKSELLPGGPRYTCLRLCPCGA